MKPEQRGILTMLKEHSARKRFALAVFFVAIVTTVAVFWALRISGLTLAEETATETDATETDATATDGEEETTTSTSNTSSSKVRTLLAASGTTEYYFADNVALSDASDEDYIVYTIDDTGNYYLVKSDGSFYSCTDVSSYSTGTEKATYSTSEDAYYWGTTDSSDTFKLTSISSFDLEDYLWTLTNEDTEDASGNKGYTLYNSTSGNYLAPGEDVYDTISGTLDNSGNWSYNSGGDDFLIDGDTTEALIFTITCTAQNANSTAYFGIELYDTSVLTGNPYYITTNSDGGKWYFSDDGVTVGTEITAEGSDFTVGLNETYTVIVERENNDTDDTADYTISYYDSNGDLLIKYVAADTLLTSTSQVYAHMLAHVGTFEMGVAYATKAEKDNEIDADCSDLTVGTEGSSDDPVLDISESTGNQSLTGDFDITYTFTNSNSSQSLGYRYWFYVLVLSIDDSSADGSYVYLYANGNGKGTTNTYTLPYGDGDSFAEIQKSSSCTWTNVLGSYSYWRNYMCYGTQCTINIKREGSLITVEESISYNGSVISTCVSTFECSYDLETSLTAIGNTCTLSGITLTDNTSDYEITDYAAYSAVTTSEEAVYLATSNTSGWTAYTDTFTSEPYLTSDPGYETVSWTAGSTGMTYYLARIRSFTAYFDGTNGAVGYYNRYVGTDGTNSAYVVTSSSMDPTGTYVYVDMSGVTSTNTGRYSYTANGWYDIYFNEYYDTDTTTIQYEYGQNNNCTVLYADWVATEFVGYDSTDTSAENTPVTTLDTSSFISTNVFDYNDLFNLYSAYLDSTSVVSATEHSEVWKFTTSSYGTYNLFGKTALGFVFLNTGGAALTDIDGRGSFTFDSNHTVNGNNTTVNAETAGLLTFANIDSTNLLKYLFDTTGDYAAYNSSTGTGVIGKNYAGTANYLFQYDDDSGYYYFDSARNAAFYDSANSRFYLYDYLVRMIKSTTDTDDSANDFLPFNYGYVTAPDADGTKQIVSSSIDYFFGMETDITFYLPDDTGTYDSYAGVYGNQTSEGSDMVFKFMGDDDVWIFVDDELVLDLGGIHDAVYGEINFSTGTVTVVSNTNEYSTGVTYVDQSIDRSDIPISINSAVVSTDNGNGTYTLTYNGTTVGTTISMNKIDAGTHKLTFYYLERGASESNAAIYLNVSSEYKVDLTKVTAGGESVEGATFDVYNTSSIDNVGDSAYKVRSYTIGTGETDMSISGLVTGNTYYIVESNAPEGYPLSHNIIKVYVSSSGYAEITIYASDKATVLASWTSADSSFSTGAYLTATPNVTEEIDTDGTIIYSIVFTYSNNLEYELPATGSTGVQPYLMAGEALILIAGAGLILIAFYQAVRLRRMRAAGNRGYKREKSGNRMRCSGARDRPDDAGGTHSCSGGAYNYTGEPYHSSDVVESARGAYPAHGSLARKRATGPGKRE